MNIELATDNHLIDELEFLRGKISELEEYHQKNIKLEEEYKRVLEKYEFIVNAHSEFMSLISRDYKFEAVNDAYCSAHHKTRNEFINKTVWDVWGKEAFETYIKPLIDQCLAGEIIKSETSFTFAGGIGDRYYNVSYYPYKDNTGKISHVVVMTDDITEKKQAELALIESEGQLKELNQKKDEYLAIINSDLERAAGYVLSQLPQPLDSDCIKAYWKFIPSYHLGGDSFGYHWNDNKHFAFYLLDVSGHGVGPALHSLAAMNLLKMKSLLNTDYNSPEQVLNSLNKTFQMSKYDGLYFSIWYCVLDCNNNILYYAGAGHPPLLLINENIHTVIDSNNFLIGYYPDYKYKSGKLHIDINTSLYLFSDGAYEIRKSDGTMMSVNDLFEYLIKNRHKNGHEIEMLYNQLKTIRNNYTLDDDFVMLRLDIF